MDAALVQRQHQKMTTMCSLVAGAGDGEPTSNKQSSVLRLRQCGIQLVCDHCDPSLQGSKEDQVDDKSLCNGKLKFFEVHSLWVAVAV